MKKISSGALTALRNTAKTIKNAVVEYAKLGDERNPPVTEALLYACFKVEKHLEEVEKLASEHQHRFDKIPVLQANLLFEDGSTRRVAVAKPAGGEIDEPFIGEMFYAALQKQGVLSSLESFPVLVIDRRKRVIAIIPVAKT